MNELLNSFDRLGKPIERVTLVDIDSDVMEMCRHWMPTLCGKAYEDPRTDIVVGDALD